MDYFQIENNPCLMPDEVKKEIGEISLFNTYRPYIKPTPNVPVLFDPATP